MKKLLLLLLTLAYLPLRAAGPEPIPAAQLELGKDAAYCDGIYTVTVPLTANLPNVTRGVRFGLDPRRFAGQSVRFCAEMRYRDIGSDTTGQHVGGKILGAYQNAFEVASYTASRSLLGTDQSWQTVSYFCEYPAGMKSGSVVFGLQQAWGTLEFRNPTMEFFASEKSIALPDNFVCEYSAAVAGQAPLRGMMSPPPNRITGQDIRDIAALNANLLRYQITDGIKDVKDLKEYERWMDQCLDKLDSLMPVLKECNIKVIIDMHVLPGGRYRQGAVLGTAGEAAAKAYGNQARFLAMEEDIYRQAYLDTWRRIAKRYRDNPVIYGYDLMNEPEQRGFAKYDYLSLQYDAAKAIREIDPETPVIVESNRWASPLTYDKMSPLPLKNMIYQVHMYEPGPYTHQGVGDKLYIDTFPQKIIPYPGDGWDRQKIGQVLQPVIDFQKKYHAKILVGEFSVTIWAPGGAQYLDDVIGVFEQNNWDWTYHAFREWEGWSVEHAGTPKDIKKVDDTDRKQILLKYYKRNNQ